MSLIQEGIFMKVNGLVIALSSVVALLAIFAAAAGLFTRGRGEPISFTTLCGIVHLGWA